MKIHPRSACATMAITVYAIGFGLADLFNWDVDKVGCILIVICLIANFPLYFYFSKKYYAKDDTSNDDTESDIKQNEDNKKG